MDNYWRAVGDHLAERKYAGDRVAGPIELGQVTQVGFGYVNLGPSDADRIQALVLHKGRYRELNRQFLRDALERLQPSFANEVFIVLEVEGPQLDATTPHLAALEQIRVWAQAEDAAPSTAQDASQARMTAAYLGGGTVLIQTLLGHLMVAPGEDRSITPHLIRDGYFDLGLTRFIRRAVRPGMTYVDVGANIGVYALIAAAGVGDQGWVVAIEANPRIAEMLQDNLAINGFEAHSSVLNFAAADREEVMKMYAFARRHGGNTLVPRIAEEAVADYAERISEIEVRAQRLDVLLAEYGSPAPNLIKIDVEGFEPEVLRGARGVLRAAKPDLIMEWHPRFMATGVAEMMYQTLADDLGYGIGRVDPDGQVQETDLAELMALEHSDIVARPR